VKEKKDNQETPLSTAHDTHAPPSIVALTGMTQFYSFL